MKILLSVMLLFPVAFCQAEIIQDNNMNSVYSMETTYSNHEDEIWKYNAFDALPESSWMIEMLKAVEPTRNANGNFDGPFIMMAGYMDSDISYPEGGILTMLAYVTGSSTPVEYVEIYWEGSPTGAYLYDDGLHGDFGAGDELWGFTMEIDPSVLPSGEYLLELRARDQNGNFSDIWPYLTIHP
ncbi:hypothetical protein JW979_13440 [bacterium]|nr:hypothetical protein [candidate division CSSED10-310 bacterium]